MSPPQVHARYDRRVSRPTVSVRTTGRIHWPSGDRASIDQMVSLLRLHPKDKMLIPKINIKTALQVAEPKPLPPLVTSSPPAGANFTVTERIGYRSVAH